MLQVVLAEDHKIVRDGVKALLESVNNINVAGEAMTGQQVIDIISNVAKVDVVLTDVNMPVMDGLSLIKELRYRHPNIRVVVLSMFDSEKYVCRAFEDGACGYLLKSVSADELIFALRHVAEGGKYLSSELSMKFIQKLVYCSSNLVASQDATIEFSPREIEVLSLVAEGLTNAEMSDRLYISKRTVEGHRQSLIEKTKSKNTATLIKYAVLNGLIH